MRIKTTKGVKYIKANSLEELERLENEAYKELREKGVTKVYTDYERFVVELNYTDKVEEPTSIQEEYELNGIMYTCNDCPYLEKGSDKRRKKWPCKYARYMQASIDSKACEKFYRDLQNGSIMPREE